MSLPLFAPRSSRSVLRLGVWAAGALFVSACGGTSTSAPEVGTPFAIQSTNVSAGEVWRVNRPIDITFNQPVQFSTVHWQTLRIVDDQDHAALGTFVQPTDASGQVMTQTVRFVPNCPLDDTGLGAGFAPGGTSYRLIIEGTNSGGLSVLSTSDEGLAQGLEIPFLTPTGSDPASLFYDPVVGPPVARIRGLNQVWPNDPNANYLEFGNFPGTRVYFRLDPSQNVVQPDPMDLAMDMPLGLPLNHRAAPANQVSFVAFFNQPIRSAQENLDRVRLEYFDGSWLPIESLNTLESNCTEVGATVRLRPLGMLPRGAQVRMVTRQGFQDLVGQPTSGPSSSLGQVWTTLAQSGIGARADAWADGFYAGGGGANSLEDTQPTFPEARAIWGNSRLYGEFGTNGESKAWSKWLPLGLGHIDPSGTNATRRFRFEGTDANGHIEVLNGQVQQPGPLGPPLAVDWIETSAIHLSEAEFAMLDPLYVEQPALLNTARVRLESSTQTANVRAYRAERTANGYRIELGVPCLDTGDCAGLNLPALFPGATPVTATFAPTYFGVTTNFAWDEMPDDSRITIRFDAARADANGDPDPATALSLTSGWQADISNLDGGQWDFIRFEVFFELDVSGDGFLLTDPIPVLRFVSIPFDMRQ